MRLDPFRQVAPFAIGGEAPLMVMFAALPGDDFLERWEWEGGLAR